ncbi:A disintegrin and metalloproteinase with thrombospondin motifs 1-like [Diadema antillarum]|uniref:A disintegrin and metalloproteinase with thrombospondin motifs 1-like n=1 Tax=Diadema antillarum TaxID=105358 RepID=UPI003A87A21C
MKGIQFTWCWIIFCCGYVLFLHVSESSGKFDGLHRPEWTSYEVVSPVLLERGNVHRGQHHFQKRSLSFSEREDGRKPHSPQYLVEAFGEKFYLSLDRDASFIAPSFNLHVSGTGDGMDIHDVDSSTHCFYAGNVNGHPESNVVVSLCGGMFGLFHTHNGTQFYIEPQGGTNSHGVDTDTKPHVIYTSAPPSDTHLRNATGGCGVSGRCFCFFRFLYASTIQMSHIW